MDNEDKEAAAPLLSDSIRIRAGNYRLIRSLFVWEKYVSVKQDTQLVSVKFRTTNDELEKANSYKFRYVLGTKVSMEPGKRDENYNCQ